MILPYTGVFAAVFGLLIYEHQQHVIVIVTITISIIFYIHQSLVAKSYSFNRLHRGDLPYQLLFAIWLIYFQAPHFLYYIPYLLGNVGRIYIMATFKSGEIKTLTQQLILFQNQCQAFVLFMLFLEMFSFNQSKILAFVLYALIIKLKYRFFAPTRKAYNQIHFFFDRVSRNLNLRSFYHVVYNCVSMFSNDVETPVTAVQIYY